jgi:hypothetical protein
MTMTQLWNAISSNNWNRSHLLKFAFLTCAFVAESSAALGACTAAPALTKSSTIPESFWGMHQGSYGVAPLPTVSYSIVRTNGTWPTIHWEDVNRSNGYYDWRRLDALVNDFSSKGKDIMYTFTLPPSWAGRPSVSNLTPWTNFVKAIVARYCNKIKYWELWNEPNATATWTGTTADMVAMAKAAYPIIKNGGGIVVSPSPQGAYSYSWLRDYFAKGGGAYTDVVAAHAYVSGSPEGVTSLLNDVKKVMTDYGLSNKPLWDTEHSWGDTSWPYGNTTENQSKFLSRSTILEASLGLGRSFWYVWANYESWSQLFDGYSQKIRVPGQVYQVVHDWLTGRTVSCTVNGYIYSCSIGSSGMIYWHSKGWGATVTVDSKYTKTQNIYGVNGTIYNRQVKISGIPVLVQ